MTFDEWILKGQNCIGFVLVIFAFIFMFFVVAAWNHTRTAIFCILAVIVCLSFGIYFLSDKCLIHHPKQP